MIAQRHPTETKLRHRLSTAPSLRRGDRTICLYRDAEVVIPSWTNARISWPRCRTIGHRRLGAVGR
jgi:hypothetical protein